MHKHPIQALPTAGVPIGTVVASFLTGTNLPPPGWLLCDGSAIDSNRYPQLASLMPNTPNLAGLVLVGAGTAAVSGTSYAFGASNGQETHPLTTAEMPPHSHTVSLPQGNQNWDGGGGNTCWGGGSGLNVSSDTIGGGQAHNNMQPYYVVNYIICAGAS